MMKNNNSGEDKKWLFFVWCYLLIVWCASLFLFFVFDESRFFIDPADFSAYFERGKWVIGPTVPISEYPQIPTILFGLNYYLASSIGTGYQFVVFISIFSLEMTAVLFLSIKTLSELLPKNKKGLSLLFLLPPTVYFAINRFDILPVLLCLLALKSTVRKKWVLTSIILAVATLTKWYPALLFPGIVYYAYRLESKFNWKMIYTFIITGIIIVFPTYITGSFEAVFYPYQLHAARGMEFVAFPLLIYEVIKPIQHIIFSQSAYFLLFFILQTVTPLSILFIRLDSIEMLHKHCGVVISMFILFARITSPQWFLWLLPFLILTIKGKVDLYLIILFNLCTYLFFPVVFDVYGSVSIQFKLMGVFWYIFLITFVFRFLKGIRLRIPPSISRRQFITPNS